MKPVAWSSSREQIYQGLGTYVLGSASPRASTLHHNTSNTSPARERAGERASGAEVEGRGRWGRGLGLSFGLWAALMHGAWQGLE